MNNVVMMEKRSVTSVIDAATAGALRQLTVVLIKLRVVFGVVTMKLNIVFILLAVQIHIAVIMVKLVAKMLVVTLSWVKRVRRVVAT
jgi:hypothetical protein